MSATSTAEAPAARTTTATYKQGKHTDTKHTHTSTCVHTQFAVDIVAVAAGICWCCCCHWANSANFRCLVIDINEVESESVSTSQQAYMQTIQLQITHTPCAPRVCDCV